MPLIQVTIARGRTPEELDALGKALTEAAVESIGAKREIVQVMLSECEPEHMFAGGQSLAAVRAAAVLAAGNPA